LYSWDYWGRIKDHREALRQAEARLKRAVEAVLRNP
jgi:hypothetical protein